MPVAAIAASPGSSRRPRADSIDKAVSRFGAAVSEPLRLQVGSPEDQLRGPFERLLMELGKTRGLRVVMHGEVRLPSHNLRPDYAVDVDGIRVGYVELKAPHSGVPTSWNKKSRRNEEQWEKLRALPSVLYGDGNDWALFRYGDLVGSIANLDGDLTTAGSNLRPHNSNFELLTTSFLVDRPQRPRSLNELVKISAGLCDLLRAEITEELALEAANAAFGTPFTTLAEEWRSLLFPRLADDQFADAYAQTVTFALLLARSEGIAFEARELGEIARLLGKKHSVMGKALAVLTESGPDRTSVAVDTLLRVLAPVEWAHLETSTTKRYQQLYERFLERYDPDLRRKSGSYYTPRPIVSFMTRSVNHLLRRD